MFEYHDLDRLLEAIESHFLHEIEHSIIVNSINPLLAPLSLLNLLYKMKERHHVLEFRI